MFCCGVDEIHGLEEADTPKEFVDAVAREAEGLPALMFYTARAKCAKKGNDAAKYIMRNNLGKVVRVTERPVLNTNSGNKIHMWVWTLNKKEFEKLQIKATSEANEDWLNRHPWMR